MMRPEGPLLIFAVALIVLLTAGGWRTAADADRDEQTRSRLRSMDNESFALEQKVHDLDVRVKALEAR